MKTCLSHVENFAALRKQVLAVSPLPLRTFDWNVEAPCAVPFTRSMESPPIGSAWRAFLESLRGRCLPVGIGEGFLVARGGDRAALRALMDNKLKLRQDVSELMEPFLPSPPPAG